MKTLLYICISISFLISCTPKNQEDTYQIINLIGNKIIKNQILYSNKNENFDIAIYPYFYKVRNKHRISDNCQEFKNIYEKLLQIDKDSDKINLKKIKIENAKIFIFTKNRKNKKDYILNGYNFLFSFSNISFNNDKTKAVISVSFGRSRLDDTTSLFFLSKNENVWKIKCIQITSIS